jgi:hypothetical protein
MSSPTSRPRRSVALPWRKRRPSFFGCAQPVWHVMPSRGGARGRAQQGGRRRYQGAQGDTGTSSLHHLSPSRPLTCRSVGYGYPVRCDGPGGDRRPDQGCVDQASREEFMSLAAVEVADKNRVSGHEPGSLPYFPATPAEGVNPRSWTFVRTSAHYALLARAFSNRKVRAFESMPELAKVAQVYAPTTRALQANDRSHN